MKTILIFEDDLTTNIIYKRIFEEEYSVLIYNTYDEYLQSDKKNTEVDLIIVDIGLPGSKNGIEIMKVFKAEGSVYKDIPILVSTAYTTENSIVQAKSVGAEIVLQKPVGIKKIFSTVTDMLK